MNIIDDVIAVLANGVAELVVSSGNIVMMQHAIRGPVCPFPVGRRSSTFLCI